VGLPRWDVMCGYQPGGIRLLCWGSLKFVKKNFGGGGPPIGGDKRRRSEEETLGLRGYAILNCAPVKVGNWGCL